VEIFLPHYNLGGSIIYYDSQVLQGQQLRQMIKRLLQAKQFDNHIEVQMKKIQLDPKRFQ
jgi:hypothetical protein